MFKIIKSIFSTKSSDNVVNKNLEVLYQVSNGLGKYSACSSMNDDIKKSEYAKEMLSILNKIEEQNMKNENSDICYMLSISYRNYCSWFVRGDDRRIWLNKCVELLKKSLQINPDNIDAKSELGRLLIEEKLIRDIEKGIHLLDDLKTINAMPSYLNSILSKAQRQLGYIGDNKSFNLCLFDDPSPAVFREERKRFRALIRKYKKENSLEELRLTLDQYYKLALLAYACYGEHDCNSGVIGWQYDKAVGIVKEISNKIDQTYKTHGYIENSNFISQNDWKEFVRVFGESSKRFNPDIMLR